MHACIQRELKLIKNKVAYLKALDKCRLIALDLSGNGTVFDLVRTQQLLQSNPQKYLLADTALTDYSAYACHILGTDLIFLHHATTDTIFEVQPALEKWHALEPSLVAPLVRLFAHAKPTHTFTINERNAQRLHRLVNVLLLLVNLAGLVCCVLAPYLPDFPAYAWTALTPICGVSALALVVERAHSALVPRVQLKKSRLWLALLQLLILALLAFTLALATCFFLQYGVAEWAQTTYFIAMPMVMVGGLLCAL